MYELLICWRSTGKTPVIELGEFRKRIGVLDTEYTRTDNLKMRVIELALSRSMSIPTSQPLTNSTKKGE